MLEKIVEWCIHHQHSKLFLEDREPPDLRKRSTEIEAWDQRFMEVDQEMLFEIILGSYSLEIMPLTNLGCMTVANMIKGKSPEEIRKIFNIQNDFTPEEEDQIRRENEWADFPSPSYGVAEWDTSESVEEKVNREMKSISAVAFERKSQVSLEAELENPLSWSMRLRTKCRKYLGR